MGTSRFVFFVATPKSRAQQRACDVKTSVCTAMLCTDAYIDANTCHTASSILLVLGKRNIHEVGRSLNLEETAEANEEDADPESADEEARHDVWCDPEGQLLFLFRPRAGSLSIHGNHEESEDAQDLGESKLGHGATADRLW